MEHKPVRIVMVLCFVVLVAVLSLYALLGTKSLKGCKRVKVRTVEEGNRRKGNLERPRESPRTKELMVVRDIRLYSGGELKTRVGSKLIALEMRVCNAYNNLLVHWDAQDRTTVLQTRDEGVHYKVCVGFGLNLPARAARVTRIPHSICRLRLFTSKATALSPKMEKSMLLEAVELQRYYHSEIRMQTCEFRLGTAAKLSKEWTSQNILCAIQDNNKVFTIRKAQVHGENSYIYDCDTFKASVFVKGRDTPYRGILLLLKPEYPGQNVRSYRFASGDTERKSKGLVTEFLLLGRRKGLGPWNVLDHVNLASFPKTGIGTMRRGFVRDIKRCSLQFDEFAFLIVHFKEYVCLRKLQLFSCISSHLEAMSITPVEVDLVPSRYSYDNSFLRTLNPFKRNTDIHNDIKCSHNELRIPQSLTAQEAPKAPEAPEAPKAPKASKTMEATNAQKYDTSVASINKQKKTRNKKTINFDDDIKVRKVQSPHMHMNTESICFYLEAEIDFKEDPPSSFPLPSLEFLSMKI